MRNKIGALKITVCAIFLALFAAATLLSSASKTSALKISDDNAENPQNCAACHLENFPERHQTVHRTTVRKAAIDTVRGDFTNKNRLEYNGVTAEMTGDNENFYIKIGEDKYKIEAVVGVKYIEQYVAEKNGELHSLPVVYDLKEKRWIHLNDTDFEEADSSRHLQNWKTDCAACHGSAGANDLPNGLANNTNDFGISCAACHGNAAEHLQSKNSLWAQIGFKTASKIVNPQRLSSDASMMVCANCHTRDSNETLKIEEIAAESFDNTVSAHRKNDSDAERFWANGAHKFSGNEFQSIVRSVCYVQSKAGGHGIAGEKINCVSCHSANETNGEFADRKSFDQNCVNCHTQFSDDAAIVEHTKHPLDSEASNCASCHQPEIVFARTRFTRTHEISVPDPALTAEKQIPNACNLCHTDKSVNWAIASGISVIWLL